VPAEIVPETNKELAKREEESNVRQEPSVVTKIETEEDLEKFASE